MQKQKHWMCLASSNPTCLNSKICMMGHHSIMELLMELYNTLLLFQFVCRVHRTLPNTLGYFKTKGNMAAQTNEGGAATVIKLSNKNVIAQEQIGSFRGS